MAGAAPSAAPSARRGAAAASSRRRSPGPGSPEWRVPRPMTAPALPGAGAASPPARREPPPLLAPGRPAAEPGRAGPPRSRLSRGSLPLPAAGITAMERGGDVASRPPEESPGLGTTGPAKPAAGEGMRSAAHRLPWERPVWKCPHRWFGFCHSYSSCRFKYKLDKAECYWVVGMEIPIRRCPQIIWHRNKSLGWL